MGDRRRSGRNGAAKILHERGHEVTLFEATNQLGGEFLFAGEAPGKAEMKSAAMEMAAQVEKLVTVHKNTKLMRRCWNRQMSMQ